MTTLELAYPKAIPTESLLALDRLNSWVRSKSWYPDGCGPKNWIYAMKGTALRQAFALGLRADRSVYYMATCRDCGGTGRYVDNTGFAHDHCWACENTGEVKLRFVESTIPAGKQLIIWHSPFPRSASGYITEAEVPVTDWKPNTPGRDMTPAEVCEALLLAEDAFAAGTPKAYMERYIGEDDLHNDQYRLHLGQCANARCSVCHRPVQDGTPYTARAGRILWTELVCTVCRRLVPKVYEHFRKVPPVELTSDPAVMAWILAHHPST